MLSVLFLLIFAINVFSADWYALKGYEKCKDTGDGFLICREDYVNDFCHGKERVWFGHKREKPMYDRNVDRVWYDRKLVSVRNLNYKCEFHGWAKFLLPNGAWRWQCYLNNREMEDSACKGFRK